MSQSCKHRRGMPAAHLTGAMLAALLLGSCSLFTSGLAKKVTPGGWGTCRVDARVVGPEDLTIHPASGVAFISAYDREAEAACWKLRGDAARTCFDAVPAGLYTYDLTDDQAQAAPVPLTTDRDGYLFPHGIGLYTAPGAAPRLFVINHPPVIDGDARPRRDHIVEVFDYQDGRLVTAQPPIRDESLLYSPNDLIPVGPASFYVTNDHGTRRPFWQLMENLFMWPGAYVLHYDAARIEAPFRKVARRLAYANGVNVSAGGDTVYVATTQGRHLLAYRRDPDTGDLHRLFRVKTKTGVDNIEVAADGSLWIGAHPKALRFVGHSRAPREKTSPSQVIKIAFEDAVACSAHGGRHDGQACLYDDVYVDDGAQLSGSSVAAYHQGRMLVGTVFREFAVCDVPPHPPAP